MRYGGVWARFPPTWPSNRADGVEDDNAVAIEGLQEASDGALVVAIARYHQEALAEAYRRNGGAVFALARRLLADTALAEEVVQEVFLRLWTQPDRFDPERGSLRSYLLAQSHGRAVDLLRSETSRRRREEREARATAERGYDIEREVLDLAVGDHVKEVLDRLPPDERQPIELAYFGGYTYRQVATRLDQPEGTVKSRIRAGLKRMRADLIDVGIGGVWSES
jgi:RNA polymerase sigma-70 factor, ECF subfamily